MGTFNRIETCTKCKNKSFDKIDGLVCGLTGEIPQHIDHCPFFEYGYKESLEEVKNYRNGGVLLSKRKYRLFHFFFDFIMIFGLVYLFYYIGDEFELNIIWEQNVFVVLVLIFVFYFYLFEWFFGRTPAKYFTYSYVVNEMGLKPDASSIMVRTIIRLIPIDPFTFLNSNKEGLHDSISKTKVIRREPIKNADAIDEWEMNS